MPDAALSWLLENDPEARGKPKGAYGRQLGILTPHAQGLIREREVSFGCIEHVETSTHCPSCDRRRQVEGHTVE